MQIVVWNGTMEREAIRAQQLPAPPLVAPTYDGMQTPEAVTRALVEHGALTMPQLKTLTGRNATVIYSALQRFRAKGWVRAEQASRTDKRLVVYVWDGAADVTH